MNKEAPADKDEAFMDLACSHCAFAKEAGGDIGLVLHLIGQSQTHCQGQVAAHDGVPAVETRGTIKQVHRATATARTASARRSGMIRSKWSWGT